MPEWSEWDENTDNPYLVWRDATVAAQDSEGTARFSQYGLLPFHRLGWQSRTYQLNLDGSDDLLETAYDKSIEALRTRVPSVVLNADQQVKVTDPPPRDELPIIEDPDTVIMGVIDIGIPLGHSRLRDCEGKSRILAAWQQLAPQPSAHIPFGHELFKPEIDHLIAECSGGTHTGWLDEEAFNRATAVVDMENTFGVREAAKVAAHGAHVIDLAAGCDPHVETDFAKKVKIIAVNMPNVDIVGSSGEYTNGFVLAGIERILTLADAIWQNSFNQDGKLPEGPCKFPIVINISLGKQAGAKNSLDLFPAYLRSLEKRREKQMQECVTDSVLAAMTKAGSDDEKIAAAIEVMAGAIHNYEGLVAANEIDLTEDVAQAKKNGTTDPSVLADVAWQAARDHIWLPSNLNFVMPVGNDNLGRCNALFEPDGDNPVSLNWRIMPDDQSPNFVEVWISPDKDTPDLLANAGDKLRVSLVPPNGAPSGPNGDIQNAVTWFGNQAAVFRETHEFSDKTEKVSVLRYVLCVAPTKRALLDQETAEAGVWRLQVENMLGPKVECVCSVQTDQGVLPGSATSRRSYFDDPDYTVYNSYQGMGDLRDTYAYPEEDHVKQMYVEEPKAGVAVNLDILPPFQGDHPSPVKRHGTINATAAHERVSRVAGHRKTDGKPAFYSASGRGVRPGKDGKSKDDGLSVRVKHMDSSRAPTASMPTEDGPMHLGVLAAGGANGSVVAMRGTSVAAPQAARLIAQELVKKEYLTQSGRQRLVHRARRVEEDDDPTEKGKIARKAYASKPRLDDLIEVLGKGRIESPVTPRVPRMTND